MTVTAIELSTDMQTYLLQAIGVKCGAGIIQGSSVAANHVLDLLKTEMRQAARAPTL